MAHIQNRNQFFYERITYLTYSVSIELQVYYYDFKEINTHIKYLTSSSQHE